MIATVTVTFCGDPQTVTDLYHAMHIVQNTVLISVHPSICLSVMLRYLSHIHVGWVTSKVIAQITIRLDSSLFGTSRSVTYSI